MNTTRSLLLAGALAGLFPLAGCGSSPPTRFYVLDAVTPTSSDVLDLGVGLGPVELPPYLDRNPMITREDANTISLAEFDLWAERLADGFVRALARDVGAALGTARVEPFPWGAAVVNVRVPVEVLRFDTDASGNATLVARWSLLHVDETVVAPVRISELTATSAGETRADAARALSEALGKLGSAIAAEIRAHRVALQLPGAR